MVSIPVNDDNLKLSGSRIYAAKNLLMPNFLQEIFNLKK